jgi:hypothetical protein
VPLKVVQGKSVKAKKKLAESSASLKLFYKGLDRNVYMWYNENG